MIHFSASNAPSTIVLDIIFSEYDAISSSIYYPMCMNLLYLFIIVYEQTCKHHSIYLYDICTDFAEA